MYETIINRIKNISNIIQEKALQHDERVKLGVDACELYEKLNKIEKDSLIFDIYIIYRQLGALYFESNQYLDSENHFEKSLEIKRNYNMIDSIQNECITKQMLAKDKIMIYLNTNTRQKIVDAKELIEFIKINKV